MITLNSKESGFQRGRIITINIFGC